VFKEVFMERSVKNVIQSVIVALIGIIIFAVCLAVVFEVGKIGYNFGYNVFNEKPVSSGLGKNVVVNLNKDMTSSDISKYMADNGLVEDKNVFYVQILLSDYKDKYVPGKYLLNTNMKPTQILETICSGEFYSETTESVITNENPEKETN